MSRLCTMPITIYIPYLMSVWDLVSYVCVGVGNEMNFTTEYALPCVKQTVSQSRDVYAKNLSDNIYSDHKDNSPVRYAHHRINFRYAGAFLW